jgi:hypothetical protein
MTFEDKGELIDGFIVGEGKSFLHDEGAIDRV